MSAVPVLSTRTLKVAACAVAAVTTMLALGTVVFEIVGLANSATSADPEASTHGMGLVGIQSVVEAAFAVLGAVVVSRQPRNPVGWLLILIGASFTCVGVSNQLYVHWVLPTGELSGGLTVVLWLGNWAWIPAMVSTFTLLPLLFPTGRPLTPRWRPLVWYVAVGGTLAVVSTAFLPGAIGLTPAVVNPFGIDAPWIKLVQQAAGISFGPAALASITSLVVRFRRSRGTERQQLKWVASAAVLLSVPALATLGLGGDAFAPLLFLAMLAIAMAVSVAMLRYRLYDIDVVINKALVFVVLAAFITAVYAAIVVGLGRLLPLGDNNLGLAIAATALVAVAFEPVRVRVQHWANRLVYGRRATPYEALAAMTARIGESADHDQVLTDAARLLAEGTGAWQAVVWVVRHGFLVPRGVAGEALSAPAPVPLRDGDVADLPGNDLVQPVRHEGELVGALSLRKRPGEGVSSADRRLVEELAGQAALLLANTRLRSRLTERLSELRASRQRMLAAQDEARHSLERDLHDGAQQELVALKIKLGLAGTIAAREGATGLAAGLTQTAAIADEAVETLRDVARGIYPPLLESEGLAAALSAQARRSNLAVTVLDRAGRRYPREIEATAYFCALEALQNATRHAHAHNAHIELNGTEETLTVAVTDDGAGFDVDATIHGSGLTHATDRADSAGGTLTVSSRPGHGTTIILALPTTTESTTDAVPNNATAPALAGATS